MIWSFGETNAWRPPERLTVSQWANEHRWLDPRTSSEPGRYSSNRTPYSREWMDSANLAHVRQVTIIAGTQLGKTETLNNVIGYAIHQDPGPAMFVLPRNPDVRMASQRRIMPMIQASPALVGEMTDADHDVKNVEIAFKRSVLYLRSSQSPADLASVPVRYLLADEVDKYPKWAGNEAAPLDLARERQKTFWNSICYVTTTPTTRDATGWAEYEDGDRRAFWLPCPHCGEFAPLKWQEVRFPEGSTARSVQRDQSVTYHCPECDQAIADQDKPAMLARGVWVPQAISFADWVHGGLRESDREPHRSYHLSSMYSPWLTWCDLAAQWLKSKDAPERLQNWVNSWLAEPWEEKLDAPSEDDVDRAIVPGWRLADGKIPKGVLVATAGVDVQKDGLWVVVRGWGFDDVSWLLYAGKVADFDELDSVLFRNAWDSKGKIGIRCGFIDSRHRREECMEYCRRRPDLKMAQGVDTEKPVDFDVKKLERHPGTGQPLKHSVQIWSITVGRFKDQLAHRMRHPETWKIPEDVTDDYRRQVTAEQKLKKRVRNRDRAIWVVKPGRQANHMGDSEVYAIAAAKLIRVELLRTGGEIPKPPGPPGPPRRRPPPPDFPRLSQ